MRKYWFLVVFCVALAANAFAFRNPRPATYSLPWTQNQIKNLNDDLENIWNLTNGEFNLDIVATTKTNANNGDVWLIRTGSTTYIQYKDGRVFTVSPDF